MSLADLADLTSVFVDPTAYADEDRFHAACRVLRREHPVVRVESERYRPFWALTRHADVLDVERDNEHFRNSPRPLLVPAAMEARAEANGGPVLRTLIHMDDPDHKAFRGITSSWFVPGRIRALEDRIRELAGRYIDHMADLGGSCDFVQDVAVGFPLHVILSILGLPEEDFPRILQLTTEAFGGDDDELTRSADPEERMAVMLDFFQYFMALTADRRANPTDDLASVIANATIDGEPLNDFDAASYYVIIATAGHYTTSSSISGGLEALLHHPEQLSRLRADSSLFAERGRGDDPVGDPGEGVHAHRHRGPHRRRPDDSGGRLRVSRLSVGQPGRGCLRGPVSVRRGPGGQQAGRVRLRRALLPRRPPRAPRAPGLLRGAPRARR